MRAEKRVPLIALTIALGAAAWAQQPMRRIIPLVRVRATLETTLDAKHAKPGEAVRARLDENVPIPSGPTLPKNTMLEGHVDKVQASEHHGDSLLVVTFDQAKLRGGEMMPVKVTVLSIAEPIPPGMGQPMPVAANETAGPPAQPARPGNFPPPPGTGVTPAAPEPQMPQTPQGPAPQVWPEVLTRAVPGVTLRTDVNLATSATFLAEGRNVHVPGGALLEVAVGVMTHQ